MHRIGQRIIKTSIAVFVSISIHIILLYIDKQLGIDRNLDWHAPSNMYTPFFAGIAAVYATHKDRKSSFQQAKIRSLGSIIGGYFGMGLIWLTEYFLINIYNLQETNLILYTIIQYAIVSLGIIPLIWITVSLKQSTATFITCLTYLSVTISIRNGGMPVLQFATNRVISTLIGVAIALLINNFGKIKKRNKDILFVTSLDDNFFSNKKRFSLYVKYKLNNLYYNDMPLLLSTNKPLSSLEDLFKDLDVSFPVILMNGACVYNFENKEYEDVFNISSESRVSLDNLLKQYNLNAFIHSINDGTMHIYYEKFTNDAQKEFFDKRKRNMYDNFVYATLPSDASALMYTIIDTIESLDPLIDELIKKEKIKEVDYVLTPYNKINGNYFILEINSRQAQKENIINHIKEKNNYKKVITFGSHVTDLPVMKLSDLSITLETVDPAIQKGADIVIVDNPEKLLKMFDRLFNTFGPNRIIKMYKKRYHK